MLDLTLLGCSNVAKTIANRSGGLEIGQRDIKNGIPKFRFFRHFPIFRGWGAGGPWWRSGQGDRVELCHFCINCGIFALTRLISRNIIRIDLPHAGVGSGVARGGPGGPWEAPGPGNSTVAFFCRIRTFLEVDHPDSALYYIRYHF